jgi:hypothetical protein
MLGCFFWAKKNPPANISLSRLVPLSPRNTDATRRFVFRSQIETFDRLERRPLMESFWSIGFGLLSGVAGWMISEFLAKPFRRGIDLVAEARTLSLIYANVQARARMAGNRNDGYVSHLEIPEEAETRLRKAEEVFREVGGECKRSPRQIARLPRFSAGSVLTLVLREPR